MLCIISPPLGKIRPRIENQITMGNRWIHQVVIILELEVGTLQCRTILGFLRNEQGQQTLGKMNVVSVSAKLSIQEVIHQTSVVIMQSIWFDKGL